MLSNAEAPGRIFIMANIRKPKIGIVSLGHKVYWPQFEGLYEELSQKSGEFAKYFKNSEIFDAGFADDVNSAFEAVQKLKREDIDALFLVLTTYVTSAVAAPFAIYLDVPQILVGIQPLNHLDYQKTTTYMQLCNDDICAMPEVAGVYERLGKKMPKFLVATSSETEKIAKKVEIWERALTAKAAFKYATIGYLGHTYEGMYDMHTDPTAFSRTFGAHVKMLEMCELREYVNAADDVKIKEKIEEIKRTFDIKEPSNDPLTDYVKDADLEWSARCAVGLDELIARNNLTGLAYYYKGENGNEYENIGANLILGNTLLTSSGIPLAGEADLKTCAAMLVMNRVGGGGSFAELHPFDCEDDICLIGHDGPHHIGISDKKPILRKLKKFHGKSGSGIGVDFNIKAGPISLLSCSVTNDGRMKMILGKGESISGAIPQTGNTNTRCKFGCGVEEFIERWCSEGPTHHLALGTGDNTEAIGLFCDIMNIELRKVALD